MPIKLIVCDQKVSVRGRVLKIARIDAEKYRFIEDPATFLARLRMCGERIDLFTFLQRLPDTTPKFQYPMEWDNFAVLGVSTFEHWFTNVLGFKARNKAKQAAKKGVKVGEVPFDDRLVRGIAEIYNESPVRQGKRFPHYGMNIDQIRDYAGTYLDCSVFIGAYLDNKLIGFTKLTLDETRTQAGLMHIISTIEHRDMAPTNALIAEAVRWCSAHNVSYLVYSNFAYGNKQKDSLSDFKERNGFARVEIPRYYVPLTPMGSLAFRLGMHHKLIDRMPEPLIAKFRNYRARWYDAQLRASVETSQ